LPYTRNVKSLYKQSTCMVSFPTIPHAILPIAEAIICGLPVISVKTSESLEYSNNGASAILVKMGDQEALLDSMKLILANPDLAKQNAIDGASEISKLFDPVTNTDLLLEVYASLINRNNKRQIANNK